MRKLLSFIIPFLLLVPDVGAFCELRSHRGNILNDPEHTVESYVRTLKAGATLIELDVQLSSDNIPVCIHDTTVDRTTNGTGNVVDKTLAQLKALDAGVDFGGGFAGQVIPTLEEALQTIQPYRAYVMIEAKGTGFMPYISLAIQRSGFPINRVTFLVGLFTDTAAIVRPYFPENQVWVISGDTPSTLGQSVLETAKYTNGYYGASYWPISMVANDYTLSQTVGFGLGEYVAGGLGIYDKANLGCNLFLTDDPEASQNEWGTELWADFVAEHSLGGAALTDDTDGDGYTNVAEMVFDTDPTQDDVPVTPNGITIRYSGSGANRYAEIICRTPRPVLEGYWFKVQTSSNGSSWSDASTSIVSESVANWPQDRAWRLRVDLSNSTDIVRAVPVLYSTSDRPE